MVTCSLFYVPCSMFHVLCSVGLWWRSKEILYFTFNGNMFFVLCSMFHVLCSVELWWRSKGILYFTFNGNMFLVPCSVFHVPCSAGLSHLLWYHVHCSMFLVPCSMFFVLQDYVGGGEEYLTFNGTRTNLGNGMEAKVIKSMHLLQPILNKTKSAVVQPILKNTKRTVHMFSKSWTCSASAVAGTPTKCLTT